MRVSRSVGIAVVALVAVAAVLRLHDLPHAQYRHDDETMFYLASEAVRHHVLPLAGMESSVGIPHGPLAVYVLMLPRALGATELGALWLVGLLNVAAVALTFLAMRRFVDERVAFLAALLMAVNPWYVVYSRRLWLNAVLPLFSVVFLWAVLSVAARPEVDRRRVVIAALAFAVLAQIHLGAIAHVYTVLAAVLLLRLWRYRPAARAGLLVVLLACAPYAVSVVAPRVVRLVADARRGPAAVVGWPVSVADGDRARAFLELLTSRGYQAHATHAARILDTGRGVFPVADVLLLVAFGLGVLVVGRRAWRSAGARWHLDLLLLTFVAAPVALPAPRLSAAHGVFPFYFLVTAPAMFLLVAEGFVTAAAPFFAVIGEHWPRADYGLPLAELGRFADTLAARARGAPIVIGGHDEVAEAAYRALQRRGAAVSYLDDRSVLALPKTGAALYVTTGDAFTPRALVELAGARAQGDVLTAGRHWAARLFWLDGATGGRFPSSLAGGTPTGVGDLAIVHGVDVEPVDGRLDVRVRWELARAPRELPMAQILRAVPPHDEILSEQTLLPTDLRPEDGPALTRLVYVQRFPIARAPGSGETPVPIAFRLVTRWGRRPLTGPATLGTIVAPVASPARLDRAPPGP